MHGAWRVAAAACTAHHRSERRVLKLLCRPPPLTKVHAGRLKGQDLLGQDIAPMDSAVYLRVQLVWRNATCWHTMKCSSSVRIAATAARGANFPVTFCGTFSGFRSL
jgi:hypothetical protein